MEIANECGVHTTDCNTTWQEMIDLHIAVADALHAAYINVSSSGTSIPKPLVRPGISLLPLPHFLFHYICQKLDGITVDLYVPNYATPDRYLCTRVSVCFFLASLSFTRFF